MDEKILERLNSIDKTLERNTVSLEIHIKRTELLEEQMKKVSKHVTKVDLLLEFAKYLLPSSVILLIWSKFIK